MYFASSPLETNETCKILQFCKFYNKNCIVFNSIHVAVQICLILIFSLLQKTNYVCFTNRQICWTFFHCHAMLTEIKLNKN